MLNNNRVPGFEDLPEIAKIVKREILKQVNTYGAKGGYSYSLGRGKLMEIAAVREKAMKIAINLGHIVLDEESYPTYCSLETWVMGLGIAYDPEREEAVYSQGHYLSKGGSNENI